MHSQERLLVLVCLQLEEKVREWQESGSTASRCFWVTEQARWADLISSAAKFLSDGILGKFLISILVILNVLVIVHCFDTVGWATG